MNLAGMRNLRFVIKTLFLFYGVAVLEINVMDVGGTKPVGDLVFPRIDPSRQQHSTWKQNGDSIRLTGDTIRELGVDGK